MHQGSHKGLKSKLLLASSVAPVNSASQSGQAKTDNYTTDELRDDDEFILVPRQVLHGRSLFVVVANAYNPAVRAVFMRRDCPDRKKPV